MNLSKRFAFMLTCLQHSLFNSFISKCNALDIPYDLSIIHTNDIHSHYDQTNKYGTDCTPEQISQNQCWGGIARIQTAVDQLRKVHSNTLLLDGGDQFQGTMFYNYYKGNITSEFMNYVGYDVMSIGNHEFDDGPKNLLRIVEQLDFPVVCANVDSSEYPEFSKLIKPYQVFEEYNLGVVGYITKTVSSISNVGPNLKFLDPVEPVQRAIDELKSLGIQRIIAVSHNGYHEDMDLASKLSGLSLIVGGHSHTYLNPINATDSSRPPSGGLYPTGVTNLDNETTYVVQAYCWGRFLGHVHINFKPNGYINTIEGAPIELNFNIEQDEEVQYQVKEWRKPFDEIGQRIIGETINDIDQSTCQYRECTMGDLTTDAIIASFPSNGKPDIALVNAGGIRAGLGKGSITVSQVLTAFPFGNAIVTLNVTGHQINQIVEGALTRINPINQRPVSSFIQVSGMRIHYQSAQKTWTIFINNRNEFVPLSMDQHYLLATMDFIASGGDNIIGDKFTDLIPLFSLDQLVIDYIKNNSPLNVTLEGRIVIS